MDCILGGYFLTVIVVVPLANSIVCRIGFSIHYIRMHARRIPITFTVKDLGEKIFLRQIKSFPIRYDTDVVAIICRAVYFLPG